MSQNIESKVVLKNQMDKNVLVDFEKIYYYIKNAFLGPYATKVRIFYDPYEERIKIRSMGDTISFLTFVVPAYIPNIMFKYDLQNNAKEFISDFSQYIKSKASYKVRESTDVEGILLLQ